jgi:hypothetical protein
MQEGTSAMRRFKLSMPSPAMVVASLALIVALGGTAYAALGKNSVTSKQIAPKAVSTSELAKEAVKGADLANGSVKEKKLADNAVTSAKIADGTIATGDLAPFAAKLANLGIVLNSRFADVPLPDDGTRVNATADCPAGQVAAAGGYSFAGLGPLDADDFTGDFHVIQSRPNIVGMGNGFPDQGSGFNSWRVTAVNEPGGNTGAATLTAMVVCIRDR